MPVGSTFEMVRLYCSACSGVRPTSPPPIQYPTPALKLLFLGHLEAVVTEFGCSSYTWEWSSMVDNGPMAVLSAFVIVFAVMACTYSWCSVSNSRYLFQTYTFMWALLHYKTCLPPAPKCVLGAPEACFRACMQYIFTCKLLSAISCFRSKSMMYGALAGIHFVHGFWGQKAHDYHMTEYADALIHTSNWNCAGTGSVQATHANM